ncbi:DMT family transporter [Thermosipho atlanticus]|uniref:Transporter family protein n=1 Tax=Thermosipho atlanticus DSM 15807 TaxID=1123380 RepID=A0A1M5QMD0_9BACT|nr:DMT family transporter [Thermosipho atlanticus]SHH15106.1 transporter family protein [Thermosipho atlanticus DSM 15807]
MSFLWISLRILLLSFERITGKKIVENQSVITASWGFFSFSLLTLLPFLNKVNLDIIKVSFISGTIYFFSFFLYMYALSNEDVSVVAPLYNINAIFLIFVAFIFLSEKVTVNKLLGSIMMVYGVSYLKKSGSFMKSYVNILKSKGAFAMIISSMLIAVGRTVDGFLTIHRYYDPIGYSIGVYLTMTLYFFIASFIKEKSIKNYVVFIKNKWMYLIGGGFCNAYAYIFLLKAFKYIDVSIAEPLSMVSALVSIIFVYIFFKEKIKLRFIGTVFLILGAFVIYRKVV